MIRIESTVNELLKIPVEERQTVRQLHCTENACIDISNLELTPQSVAYCQNLTYTLVWSILSILDC